jgi:putative transcriptional regulator
MEQGIEPGDLLISPPNINDSRFEKTVLLVTHKAQAGSLALCLNRPSHHKVNEILKDVDLKLSNNFGLYWGGPVAQNTVWMLHDSKWNIDATLNINDNWAITSHSSMFHHLADGDYPEYFRCFFGQASWAPGQLEGELMGDPPWSKSHSWLMAKNPEPSWILNTNPKILWMESTQISGEQAIDRWMA